ncbi:hypothetical protein [uncultured Clostridium sp.]|uniref:hypothetical protein n=1 Tax=uncultured Clostridium sp. TaxID=59620 RepID=UPI0025FA2553|nr:hypothetical protein [uncultured Clostridium sp.]
MRKIWNEEEMQFIRINIASMSIKEMAEHFNIIYEKMNDKINKMGLNRKQASGELWKKEDDEILANHFEYAPKNYLINIFPNRSWNAILQRGIKTLNLKRKSQDRYYINYKFFEEWNEDTAYIFGFIAADGHLIYERGQGNINALQFELAICDREILDKIKEKMEYEGNVIITKRETAKLQMNNKKIIEDLIQKGIPKEKKTKTISYPNSLPDRLSQHFVRGIFDGDGSVYRDRSGLRIQLLGTKKLLEKIKSIMPVDTSNNSIYDRNRNGVDVCALQIAGKKSFEIFKWMYEDSSLFLERKHLKYNQIMEALEKK